MSKSKKDIKIARLSDWQLPLSFSRDETTFSRENLFDLIFYTGQEKKDAYTNAQKILLRSDVENAASTKPYNPSHALMAIHKSFYADQVLNAANSGAAAKVPSYSYDAISRYSVNLSTPVYDKRSKVQRQFLFDTSKDAYKTITFGQLFDLWTPWAGDFLKHNMSQAAYKAQVYALLAARYGLDEITDDTKIAGLESNEVFFDDWSLRYHDQSAIKVPFISKDPSGAHNTWNTTSLASRLLDQEALARKIVRALLNTTGKAAPYYYSGNSQITTASNGDGQVLHIESLTAHDEEVIIQKIVQYLTDQNMATLVAFNADDYEDPVTAKTAIFKLKILATSLAYIYNGTEIALAETMTDGSQRSLLLNGSSLENTAYQANKPFINLYDYDDSPLINLQTIKGEESSNDYSYYNSMRISNVLANELIGPMVKAYSFVFSSSALQLAADEGVETRLHPNFVEDADKPETSTRDHIPAYEFLKAVIALTTDDDARNEYGETRAEYEFLYPWLRNESCLLSAKYLGDFIDERLFQQELTPRSSVVFKDMNIGKSEEDHENDMTLPYLPQTVPMIDSDFDAEIYENLKKVIEDPTLRIKHIANQSKVVTQDGSTPIVPPTLFDIDTAEMLELEKAYPAIRQVQMPNHGNVRVEERIVSKTIEDIWKYLKYLAEGQADDILPEFFGFKSDALQGETVHTITRENPRIAEKADRIVDILNWETLYDIEEENAAQFIHRYMKPTGYRVTESLDKPIDYKLKSYFNNESHESKYMENYDDDYEFVDDSSSYLEPLVNILNEIKDGSNGESAVEAIERLANLDTIHHPYKEYLDHPRNLRSIERELESIKFNLLVLADFLQNTMVVQGYKGTPTNSGTLYQLHKGYYNNKGLQDNDEFKDSLNTDIAQYGDGTNEELSERLDGKVSVEIPYFNAKANEEDSDNIACPNDRVIFADGGFETRYDHDNYDASYAVSVENSDAIVRKAVIKHPVNGTLLSEIYLAADGTWRSIHEHAVAPILDNEM